MPVHQTASYRPPFFARSPHVQTIYRALFQSIGNINYKREQLTTPDNDLLELDWSKVGSKNLILVLHGLEGSSKSGYVKSLVKQFNAQGWDAAALNFRGCGGSPNRLLRSYHSGETEDLDFVIKHIEAQGNYDNLVIVGYSLGGNVLLKYLGEQGKTLATFVTKAIAVSVPCDLATSSMRLQHWHNRLYLQRFLKSLKKKVKSKHQAFPGSIDVQAVLRSRSFADFDDAYTAPAHGFRDARDYWQQASSRPFIPGIAVPTLLINAADDTFLSEECFPIKEGKANHNFHLEIQKHGGHVGFVSYRMNTPAWLDKRVWEFVK